MPVAELWNEASEANFILESKDCRVLARIRGQHYMLLASGISGRFTLVYKWGTDSLCLSSLSSSQYELNLMAWETSYPLLTKQSDQCVRVDSCMYILSFHSLHGDNLNIGFALLKLIGYTFAAFKSVRKCLQTDYGDVSNLRFTLGLTLLTLNIKYGLETVFTY